MAVQSNNFIYPCEEIQYKDKDGVLKIHLLLKVLNALENKVK